MLNSGILARDINGRLRYTAAAPSEWNAGVPTAGPSLLCLVTGSAAPDHFHNGLGYEGQLLAASAGDPTEWTQGGLPMRAGRLVVDAANPITHYVAGLPMTDLPGVAVSTAPEANLYVNPIFAGGAPSVPGSLNPPTAHTLQFLTTEATPLAGSPQTWSFNDTSRVAARCLFQYSVLANNPTLQVGDVVEISYEYRLTWLNQSNRNALGVSGQSGVTMLTPTVIQSSAPVGEWERLSIKFVIDNPVWAINVRVGIGITTTALLACEVRAAEMWITTQSALSAFTTAFDQQAYR